MEAAFSAGCPGPLALSRSALAHRLCSLSSDHTGGRATTSDPHQEAHLKVGHRPDKLQQEGPLQPLTFTAAPQVWGKSNLAGWETDGWGAGNFSIIPLSFAGITSFSLAAKTESDVTLS